MEMPVKKKTPVLFTIGHSTHSLDLFKEILRAHGITQLVDIRTVPRSRTNPQYNKETLGPALRRIRIGYRHMKGLGGLRRPAKDSPNSGWINASFRGYADYMLTPEFEENLQRLITLMKGKTVCVMCAESVPWRCHRRLVGDAMRIRGFEVRHIMSRTKAGRHTLTPFAKKKRGRLIYPAEEPAAPVRQRRSEARP